MNDGNADADADAAGECHGVVRKQEYIKVKKSLLGARRRYYVLPTAALPSHRASRGILRLPVGTRAPTRHDALSRAPAVHSSHAQSRASALDGVRDAG
jgi:hypothetical protein